MPVRGHQRSSWAHRAGGLELKRCNHWSFGMEKKFHPTLDYGTCACLSMLVLKLNYVDKGVPEQNCSLVHSSHCLPYITNILGFKEKINCASVLISSTMMDTRVIWIIAIGIVFHLWIGKSFGDNPKKVLTALKIYVLTTKAVFTIALLCGIIYH